MSRNSLSAINTDDERDETTTPERRLMMATILNAINDATGRSSTEHNPGARERHRIAAINWFKSDGKDFRAVCLLAGFNPATVRDTALAYIDGHATAQALTETLDVAAIAAQAGLPPKLVRSALRKDTKASPAICAQVYRAVRELEAQAA